MFGTSRMLVERLIARSRFSFRSDRNRFPLEMLLQLCHHRGKRTGENFLLWVIPLIGLTATFLCLESRYLCPSRFLPVVQCPSLLIGPYLDSNSQLALSASFPFHEG